MLPIVPLADATLSVALLGPTNTGKTHRAIERMLEHESGMIGLPLRLLAREVYDRISARLGEDRVALVTGEEKRLPRLPAYWVCTTEAMPLTREVDFLAVDEIQLATHDERGHVFTERLLHARGRRETWFMGSSAMREMVERLVPAARQEQHPRLSRLRFAGASKLSRLPPRSAVVAFSIPELYRLAGQLRALRGGTAVVLGALSPRARNAQVAMFQAGEVDYLVATDAIGMGLNLDISHVAFASLRKFDGRNARSLTDAEIAQIAGRAGRHLRDGSFGTVSPLELSAESAQRVEEHRFEAVRRVRYRSVELDYASAEALPASLSAPPPAAHFAAVPAAVDLAALRALLQDPSIALEARREGPLQLLWQVCQIPDFRQILFEVHVELLRDLYLQLARGPLQNDYLERQVRDLDQLEGDVDTLLSRMARLRTWAFVAHRPSWAAEPGHWRERLAALEDRLSDALHAGLVNSFVERRTRARGAARRSNRQAPAQADDAPQDRHHPFAALRGLRARVSDALEPPAGSRLEDLADAPHESFQLDPSGELRALGLRLGHLVRGSARARPDVRLADLDELAAGARSRLSRRLLAFSRDSVSRLLAPLAELRASERAPLRAIAYQLESGLGCASSAALGDALRELTDADRALLARAPISAGRLSVFAPQLLEPEALALRALLVRTHQPDVRLPPPGRAVYRTQHLPTATWLALGHIALGPRAYRIDLAETAATALADGENPARALHAFDLPPRELREAADHFRQAFPK